MNEKTAKNNILFSTSSLVVRLRCNVVALADGALTLQMDNIAKRSVRVCPKGC